MSASRPLSMNSSPIAQPAYGARYFSGAGSSAPAWTMMVCSIAPYWFRISRMRATWKFFWPMET